MMRRTIPAAAMLAILMAAGGSPGAAPVTVKGEVVDVQCQLKDGSNAGADHADCALSCARRGAAMGILAADGVYTITGEYTRENNRRLLDFVAKTVEATGEVTEKDGKKVIDVTSMTASE